MSKYYIVQSKSEDLDASCQLFLNAIEYQKRKGYPTYRCDDRETQASDIANGQHYKVVAGNEIAAIFSMWYVDEKIWRERDQGNSIYLHRIVTNQDHKGQGLLEVIIRWVSEYAKENKKSSLRIDTWDNNPDLIEYYIKQGFKVIEHFTIPDTDEMPVNCRGNAVVLMEYEVI